MNVIGPRSSLLVSPETSAQPSYRAKPEMDARWMGLRAVLRPVSGALLVVSALQFSPAGAQQTSNAAPGKPADAKAANFLAALSVPVPNRPPALLPGYGDKLPLAFEDRGDGAYTARSSSYTIDLRAGNASIAFADSSRVELTFSENGKIAGVPSRELPGKVNYILGNNPANWKVGLSTFERIDYREVLPSVDVGYYGKEGRFEFDLIVKPGAEMRTVQFHVEGAKDLHRERDGSLVSGEFRLKAPQAYQESGKTVAVNYQILGKNRVGFRVGRYDRDKPLIIDPVLVYGTRLGGGNSFSDGTAIAVDSAGNAYVGGVHIFNRFPGFAPCLSRAQGLFQPVHG